MFKMYTDLKTHKKVHDHVREQCQCSECGNNFKCSRDLISHIETRPEVYSPDSVSVGTIESSGTLWESFGTIWELFGTIWESFGTIWETPGAIW